MLGKRLVDSLRGRTVVVTGASRGIGRAIALRCAAEGATVALLARSVTQPSHASLEGDLESVAREINSRNGGTAWPYGVDLRDDDVVASTLDEIAARHGLDAVVANASALDTTPWPSASRYDLLMCVNMRGTYSLLRSATPHLIKSDLRHFLTVAPPLHTLSARWLQPHAAYTASKYGMTMLTLGASEALRANTVWPKKMIQTAATLRLERTTGMPAHRQGLPPQPFADVVARILSSDTTATCLLDDDVEPVDSNGMEDAFTAP